MTERFSFRLNRLLSLRERAQDRAATQLAEASAQHARIDIARAEAAGIAAGARAQMRGDRGEQHGAGEYAALQWLSECADIRVAALQQELVAAEAEADRCRHELMLRTRERRVLERLREKQAEHWREDSGRRAQLVMDDVALRISTARTTDDR